MAFNSGAGSVDSATLMDQVRKQMATQMMAELLETVRDKCFEKCVTRPGSSLSSSEQTCLVRCTDRYSEALQIVAKAVASSAEH